MSVTTDINVHRPVEQLLGQLTLREKVGLLSGRDAWNTLPIERLGIPSVVMTDGPSGVRANNQEGGRLAGPTTAFPTGVGLAATWDPALLARVGRAMAEETLAMGCDILLGPCVNIVRTPLAGRNFETFSEDPYLAGRLAVGWIRGLQDAGVGASLKHLACNNQETERFRSSSEVDERTLREIYLPAFETAVREARPWTVMCSYNRVNGIYASQNRYLLTQILRDEWGFDGAVVSDWGANHSTVESVAAGLDLEMPGPARYFGKLLVEAAYNWQIDGEAINRAAGRILELVARTGKLHPGSSRPAGAVNTPEHQALAREAAEASIVLLKNENAVLPLDPSSLRSLAVIGPNAVGLRTGGGGSSYVRPLYSINGLEGLRARLGETVAIEYEQGCDDFATPPVVRREWLLLPDGSGSGLRAEYYNNTGWSGSPALVRTEAGPDFWWFGSSPAEQIEPGCFSARWQARLVVPATGAYMLQLSYSGTCRVYLDGELVAGGTAPDNEVFYNSRHAVDVQRRLVAGQPYDFTLEFAQHPGQDFAHTRLGMVQPPGPDGDRRLEHAVELARRCDATVIFAGMPEGYETESADRPDLDLPAQQVELIRAVAAANPHTVVVLNAGAPVVMPWLDAVPALLLAHYPGMEGGAALARVLCGDVNPGGKLTVTFPRRLADTPAWVNPAYAGQREVRYGEGIFVGYRYYDEREIEPLFPFGFGLSYTSFAYSDLDAPSTVRPGEPFEVTLRVTNTGNRAGQEVVQLYVHDVAASLPRPPQELKGFARVALEPGASTVVSFKLEPRALAFYDPVAAAWVAEPGEFVLLAGSSSRDIRARATITLSGPAGAP